jgi:hypothetical protein
MYTKYVYLKYELTIKPDNQQQDDYVPWQRTFTSQAQQITNDHRLPIYQSQIMPTEENNSYEY